MSVQLIVFPQSYEGVYNSMSYPITINFIVNGGIFSGLNLTSVYSYNGVQTDVQQEAINNAPATIPNIWYRYHTSGGPYYYNITQPQAVSGNVLFSGNTITTPNHSGIYQKLSNLTVGVNYTVTVDFVSSDDGDFWFKMYDDTGFEFQSQYWSPVLGTMTENFTFTGGGCTVAFDWDGSQYGKSCIVDSIKVVDTLNPQNQVFTDLEDGQVICDLYEDEDIPLSLSVDDFKNVAEKVQSYSKAFNLPATKRNNQIFDNIFEVTRTDNGLNFNPYKRTRAILKQDGFLLFDGYLRMLDISDKSGETSYNVNLYSEVVALVDVLKDKTFSELLFTELEHSYNYTQIKNSWQGILGLTNPLPVGSFAGTAGASVTAVLKYPFVNWTNQFSANSNGPVLSKLETAFRPFLQLKYLIDRIFAETDFTYESAFFDTVDFGKLFMDMNWGDNEDGSQPEVGEIVDRDDGQGSDYFIDETSYNSASKLRFNTGDSSPYWDNTNYKYTSPVNNLQLGIVFYIRLVSEATTATYSNNVRVAKFDQFGNVLEVLAVDNSSIGPGNTKNFSGSVYTVLQAGQYIQAQSTVITANKIKMGMGIASTIRFWSQNEEVLTSVLLNQLRSEMGQWEFLKGIMTMFNLVTMPDEDNPSNIKIEPYSDVFLNNDSDPLDWTDKIDVSEMKLMPLTDLNKKTIFKFVEDEDDYAFNVYKNSTNHLYGSKKQNEIFYTILAGEEEIIAEPFAATVIKPLEQQYNDLIIPTVYARNDDGINAAFENSPRIMYNNGIKSYTDGSFTSCTYSVPAQNGVAGNTLEGEFLQFSHLTDVPTIAGTRDFHFGECQLIPSSNNPVNDNLFNLYWLPYYSELYNPDTRIMTIKVNLSPSDISAFKFNDTVFIKNRTFRVNKIDYKPNDLATVEFILIP